MKKNYQKPEMKIVGLQQAGIICASLTSIDSTGFIYGGGGTGGARARLLDDWDYWEE